MLKSNCVNNKWSNHSRAISFDKATDKIDKVLNKFRCSYVHVDVSGQLKRRHQQETTDINGKNKTE